MIEMIEITHFEPSTGRKMLQHVLAFGIWQSLTRIFHSHFGESREKPHEKRGANTF